MSLLYFITGIVSLRFKRASFCLVLHLNSSVVKFENSLALISSFTSGFLDV